MSPALHYLFHHSFYNVLGSLIYVTVASVAVLRGKLPARLMGSALLAEFVLALLFDNYVNVGSLEVGIFVLDTLLLGFMIWLSLSYLRVWIVSAAAAQVLSVCVHIAKLRDPTIGGWVYVTAVVVCGYLVTLSLAASLVHQWLNNKDSRFVSGSG